MLNYAVKTATVNFEGNQMQIWLCRREWELESSKTPHREFWVVGGSPLQILEKNVPGNATWLFHWETADGWKTGFRSKAEADKIRERGESQAKRAWKLEKISWKKV